MININGTLLIHPNLAHPHSATLLEENGQHETMTLSNLLFFFGNGCPPDLRAK